MQGSLFAGGPVQSPERYALQNHKMLRVLVGNGHAPEFLARKGSMVAYQGAVDFDGSMQTYGERYAAGMTGEQLNLMRCHGNGAVWLANMAQDVHVVDLAYEGLTVSGDYVLALDTSIMWNVVAVDAMRGIAGVGAYQLELSGSGKVAVMTSGPPLVMRVRPGEQKFADADAVIGWSTALSVTMEAQTTTSRIYSRRGATGESWNLAFQGEGYVLVQPSELLPPVEYVDQGGLLANRGLGSQGLRGNTWGS